MEEERQALIVRGSDQDELGSLIGGYQLNYKNYDAIYKLVWSSRPRCVINIAGLQLNDAASMTHSRLFTGMESTFTQSLLYSAANSAVAADSLGIPLVLVVPGGGETPSTDFGMISLMMEDLADARLRTVVRVNGLFGPEHSNEVKRMVIADKPTVNDTAVVNPLSTRSLAWFLNWRDYQPEGEVLLCGDNPVTWYELFADVHPNVRPWEPDKRAMREYEFNWEWPPGTPRFIPFYDSRAELKDWLLREGHVLQAKSSTS